MNARALRRVASALAVGITIAGAGGCGSGCRSDDPIGTSAAGTTSTPKSPGPAPDGRGPFPPRDGSLPVAELEGGLTLELNPEDRTLSETLWRTGTWEALQTKALLERLEPGDTFVDVGANLGYYTVLAAKKVGPSGRVFAFEPDPESFALLKRNVDRNGLTNITAENKAA
ncbi:MAG: FkbM family methyltransferase, partial [Myxococcota bacterium]